MDERVEAIVEAIEKGVDVSIMGRRREELAVRCPECGDSVNNPHHAHCNIRLTDPEAVVFHCVRCDWSGAVDAEFMRRLGVYGEAGQLAAHRNAMSVRRRIGKAAREMTGGRSSRLPRMKVVPAEGKAAFGRLGYVADRLGLRLRPHEAAAELRLVPDLRALFAANSWMKPTEDLRTMSRLADGGIGFMSADRTHIIFRDTTGDWRRRYFNYRVHSVEVPGASKMYFVNRQLDALAGTLTLVVTEGVFDAVAVARHHEAGALARGDTLVASANGKGFPWLIKSIRRMGFMDLKLRVYSDSDVGLGYYGWLMQEDPLLNPSSVEIMYNEYGKGDSKKTDFGVPPEKVRIRRASPSG